MCETSLQISPESFVMAFSRRDGLGPPPEPRVLARHMAGIGMNLAVEPDFEAEIEDTLAFAAELGMEGSDFRVLALLTTWIGIHSSYVNLERLIRITTGHPSTRVRAYFAAVGQWLGKDRRFVRLQRLYEGPSVDVLRVGTAFQIARRGEDPRFVGSCLRVPDGTLRDRPADVMDPVALARRHAGYRNRVLLGPSWRADIWTALEREPDQTVADVARRVGCSFATAWLVARDFALLRQASGGQGFRVA